MTTSHSTPDPVATPTRTSPNGETPDHDVIVIGAGPAGEVAAQRAVEGGLTVAIVEASLVGGECSYYACVPTKAILRPIHALRAAERLRGLTGARLDVDQVLARRESWVSHRDDAKQAEWLAGVGITLIRGTGRLIGPRQVGVGEQVLTARHAVVVATGTRAAVPDLPGLRAARPWTNVEATRAERVPGSLIVLGGGVVACELAQTFAALGSQVTMVERGDRLLGRLDDLASDAVTDAVRADGVGLHLGRTVTSVERTGQGVRVGLDDGSELLADEVLCALGRTPNTADLGLDELGIASGERGHLQVNERGEAPGAEGWLYGVGDVTGQVALTHMGKYQARAIGDRIVARARGEELDTRAWGAMSTTAIERATVQVVFTDPEIAAVGPTYEQARSGGRPIRAVEVSMDSAAGAGLQADHYQGTARLLVDTDTEQLVGATFVGQDTAELVHAATVAIVGEVPLSRLWHAVPSFPTMSEVWLRLLEEYGL